MGYQTMICNSKDKRLLTGVLEHNELLYSALSMLLQAYHYAVDTSSSLWDFAIEIEQLYKAKISNSELRWLLANGYVEHAHERSLHNSDRRVFRQLGKIALTDRTCFVLAPAGITFLTGDSAHHYYDSSSKHDTTCFADSNGNQLEFSNGHVEQPLKPSWDSQRKELRLGGHVIRRYRCRAANQETILAVFEEENWPARVDDPLTQVAGQNARRRLLDTIKCMNRHQIVSLIRFRADGTGKGVIWELCPNDSSVSCE
jgi:hypothetical protein